MLLSAILLAASLSMPEAADSIEAVTITAEKGMVVSMSDTLALAGGDISDELQGLPGLFVNDYGGISALRSVSMHGLGSAHTAIFIDGVRVNNLQTGQADLGFLDLPGYGSAVVDYAQNSLDFKTRRPSFDGNSFNGSAGLEAGSFNTWLPSARLNFRLSDRLSLSVSGSAAVTDGDFPYGDGQKRENNGLKQFRAGADLFGAMRRGDWQAKLYWNKADRNSPGAVNWPSASRQSDMNVFIQGSMKRRFSGLYSLSVSAKAADDRLKYSDEWSETDYRQQELQLNSAHNFDIRAWWKASLSASVQWNRLETTLYQGTRTSIVSAVATSFSPGRFRADLALEFDGWAEKDRFLYALSPSLSLRYDFGPGFGATAFARRALRVPTFNELYYPGYGNAGLRPEDALLSGLGFEWNRRYGSSWQVGAELNGFYNILKDKIVSAPTEADPSIWLPYNVGKAEAAGLDASLKLRWNSGIWSAGISVAYSLQNAEDRTPDSATFGQQITGIPRHSATTAGDVAAGGWKLSASWCFRGGRIDSEGPLPDWNTLDICVSRKISRGRDEATVYLKAGNICDCRYEVVRHYPAPGRSLMLGASVKF